jgi:hypothetical protein
MAGPHVAGAVALLLSANNALTVPQVKTILQNTARKKTTTQTCGGLGTSAIPNNTFGYGIINIDSAVTSALTLLPIRIVSFKGVAKQATIELSWTTVSEDEKGMFWIEKTKDGHQWELVGTLESKGYNGHAYSLTDLSPYRGNNYYRLRHVDMDGSEHRGKVIQVVFSGNVAAQIHVAPNPTLGNVTVWTEGFDDEILAVQVIDNQGRVVMKTNIQNNIEHTLSLNELPKGLYFIKVGNVCSKILKQE